MFASETTRQAIKDRDAALSKVKTTKQQDDYRDYKHKRNQVHKLLSQDKKENIIKKVEEIVKTDSKAQWKIMKETIGWKTATTNNKPQWSHNNISKENS